MKCTLLDFHDDDDDDDEKCDCGFNDDEEERIDTRKFDTRKSDLKMKPDPVPNVLSTPVHRRRNVETKLTRTGSIV